MSRDSTESSDESLLLAWGGGDEEAGERLVERHFELVYRVVAAIAPDSNEVPDLVQRTFLACLEQRQQLQEVERFRPYLLGIARNQVRMHRRRGQSRRSEQAVEDPQEHARASWAPRLSAVAAAREQQRLLLLALRRLPLELQLPLELHYWEGLSMREIGELLDLKPGTVKKRLFTARNRLSAAMNEHERDHDRRAALLSLRQFEQWAGSLKELLGEGELGEGESGDGEPGD